MGFEIKDNTGDSLFREEFDQNGFETDTFRTEPVELILPVGTIKATQWFFNGIRMNYSEGLFNSPITLDWTGDTEMITMHFNLQGRVSIRDRSMPDGFELAGNQHNMFYGKEAEGKMKIEELRSRSFLIQFSKDAFLGIARDGNDAIRRFADAAAAGRSVAFSDTNLDIDLNLQNCINAILHCNYTDPLKRMFFYSKTVEMLVLQAESFDRAMSRKETYIRKEYDRERIVFARDYLIKNIDCPPTLVELARIAGINEYKLKRGFKETFNQTVFEYLSDVRLELARIDLLEKRRSVTEIAFQLGYSSLQHFSAAFKKKFGIPPSKVSPTPEG